VSTEILVFDHVSGEYRRTPGNTGTFTQRRLYGCAKRGCDAVNPDYLSYGAYGKSWCLGHAPFRIRLRRWLGHDV
jgi:hypothetical protein